MQVIFFNETCAKQLDTHRVFLPAQANGRTTIKLDREPEGPESFERRLKYETHTKKSSSSCRNLHHPGFRVGVATAFFIQA
ncbi:hypothetical protein SRHO_G00087170 [Serrasalmus rhombeus]